ncbi:MAG: hypothetical protein Q4C49_05175 [Bacillota bacterium]|nr:hypothetical protein [Bacillota bacterium]
MKCCECKAEEAVILTAQNEVFCLDCYKQVVMNILRRQNEFVYPNEITILEGKEKHVFAIDHNISAKGFLWSGIEEKGFYEVAHLANIESSFEEAYLAFVQKLVDTVYTKTIQRTFMSSTWNVFKKELEDVQLSQTGQLSIREDDLGHIFFVIDGRSYSPSQLADMLAPYKGMTMQFKICPKSVEVLKNDETLEIKKK